MAADRDDIKAASRYMQRAAKNDPKSKNFKQLAKKYGKEAKVEQGFVTKSMGHFKIQYEAGFPAHPEIETPADWAKMPLHGEEHYAEQVAVVEGLVKALKKEALVVCTLYSPFMLARDSVGAERMNWFSKTAGPS